MSKVPGEQNAPSLEQHKQLYEHAARFQAVAPWNWMSDSNLFGVKDPEDGQIGYCCVLGAAKECFGLVVYSGTQGLEGYWRVRNGLEDIHRDDLLHCKDCLMLSYDKRSELQKPDLQVLRILGLNVKGSKTWPVFRSYRPGYFPWPIHAGEARHLIVCLPQALDVVLRFKENPALLNPSKPNHCLVRVRQADGNWQDEWIQPIPLRQALVIKQSIDTQRLENIKQACSRQKMKWEVDFFYAPTAVRNRDERPYFPMNLLFVDRDSNFIFNGHLAAPDRHLVEFQEQFLQTLEKARIIPAQVLVCKPEIRACLEPLANHFGIKLRLVQELPAIADVRNHMSQFFRPSK